MKSKVFIFPELFVAFNLSKHSLFLGELAFIAFGDDSFFHLCRVLCVILTTAVFVNSMVFFFVVVVVVQFHRISLCICKHFLGFHCKCILEILRSGPSALSVILSWMPAKKLGDHL